MDVCPATRPRRWRELLFALQRRLASQGKALCEITPVSLQFLATFLLSTEGRLDAASSLGWKGANHT